MAICIANYNLSQHLLYTVLCVNFSTRNYIANKIMSLFLEAVMTTKLLLCDVYYVHLHVCLHQVNMRFNSWSGELSTTCIATVN